MTTIKSLRKVVKTRTKSCGSVYNTFQKQRKSKKGFGGWLQGLADKQ